MSTVDSSGLGRNIFDTFLKLVGGKYSAILSRDILQMLLFLNWPHNSLFV